MASKSTQRVLAAAQAEGIDLMVVTMPESTRTATEAAKACGCAVGQIVKSLIFQGEKSGRLLLFLVSGAHQLDAAKAAAVAGEGIVKADGRLVRDRTGFAIGGVAPFGHIEPLPTWIDRSLLTHETVWAAAGTPFAVFAIAPDILARLSGGDVVDLV